MNYNLDVETFISEVKKRPIIWDLNHEDSRHKMKRHTAWHQIATVLVPKFDDLAETEKVDFYRKMNGRWRNIRDSYVRHLKRREGSRGYMYAANLKFLNAIYKVINESSDEDHNEYDQDDSKFLEKRGHDLLEDSWPIETDESTIDIKRKKTVTNEIEYVDAAPALPDASCSYQVEDEDRSFFESLLPAVRRFDIDQKLEFRSEVLSVIKNIRSKALNFKLDPETGDLNE